MNIKEQNLEDIIRRSGKIAIAYSGGVDSTYLLHKALECSEQQVVAISLITPFTPAREKEDIHKPIDHPRLHHKLIEVSSLPEGVMMNPKDRCYHCKKELFSRIISYAKEQSCDVVFEGSNASDLGDYRPGMEAVKELNVQSPLLNAELTKSDIRQLSKTMGLDTWDKPANSCLATRVPAEIEITHNKLQQIDAAEEELLSLGYIHFRVRHHGNIARIEINKDEMHKLSPEHMTLINHKIQGLGFRYVTLDMGGYSMGSTNAKEKY